MKTVPEPVPAARHPDDGLQHDQRRARRPNTSQRLRRSGSQRWLAGVCGGIAEYVDAAPGLVRALFVLSLIPSIGVTGLGYLVLWWLLPSSRAS